MNRINKSLIITAVAGISLGALVGLYSVKNRVEKPSHNVAAEEPSSQLSMKAKRSKARAGSQQEKVTSTPATDSEPSAQSSEESGSDEPQKVVSLEKVYIQNALKRPVIDTKIWQDTKTGRFVKGTLVKDDGEYGFVLIKQTYSDKELTKVWSETAQIGDHVMVQFAEDQSKASLDAFMREHNLSLKRKMLLPGSYVFISDVVSVDHMQKLEEGLQKVAGIRNAEPNYLMFASVLPNDPRMGQLWGFKNDGKASNGRDGYQVGNDIKAQKAWDKHTDCSAKVVAVLDTGIDYNHPDLKDNMLTDLGRNFTSNDPKDFMDRQAHGTHCAGSIGAVGNNGQGVAGVCWKAKIVPIKVLGDNGSGSNEGITDALVYAAGINVDILSMSLGGGGRSNQMAQAIDMNGQKNKLLIIATGNDNKNIDQQPSYPAAYPSEAIIAVSAYNGRGDLAGFSNYGTTGADIAAPGEDIMSTTPNNRYQAFSGTSMATPVTAGVVALFWSYGPNMKAQDVKKELLATADKGNFTKQIAGNRKVNVEKVLEVLNPRASVANAAKGSSIALVNTDAFEFQVKNDNPYTAIKSVEVFSGTTSLGKADGDKVSAKIPLGDGSVKVTVKVTDEQGRTFTTEVLDIGVDLTKSIKLDQIDVSEHKGDVICSFVRTNEKMEKTTLYEANVKSTEFCDKICGVIMPTAFTSKGTLACTGTLAEKEPVKEPAPEKMPAEMMP